MKNRIIEPRFMTLEEVAQALGMTAREVHLHEKNALQKLRNWAKAGKHISVNLAQRHWEEK